jgi:hypothetical protein
MVQRLYALTADKIPSTQIAKMLNLEFGVTLTRNAVLGRLFRDRQGAANVPEGNARGGVKGKRVSHRPKKNNWRKDDEKWLHALIMRRRGHTWLFVAAQLKIPVANLKARLRKIADADIREGGKREEWSYVIDFPSPPGDYGFE